MLHRDSHAFGQPVSRSGGDPQGSIRSPLLVLLGIAFSVPALATPVATPYFLPGPGTYQSAQSVSISDNTSGAAIYFTTDGSTPTRNSAHYTAPIPVAVNTTIKAIALATGLTRSAVATARYTIVQPAATPVLTPGSGSYSTAQQVAISDATSGATIYYTEDGSTPTRSSARYTAPITVSHSETIKAAAFATGYSRSNTAAATYRISGGGVAKPTFSPAAGTYDSEQTVSLHDATPGATIYYTTDGTAPTENSQVYVDPIPATTTQTIKAIAQVPGGSSAVASATYQVPESVLYSFRSDGSDAVNPAAGLIQGSDGVFYGTSYFGGANGLGTVFTVTTAGTESVLHSFGSDDADGANPNARLLESAGAFYGTTINGGSNNLGTVFKITAAGQLTVLHSFGGADGTYPYAELIRGIDGLLYGTTARGGSHDNGTVFEITEEGAVSVLYSFGSNGPLDAAVPSAGLVQDSDGSFYGTTAYGGLNGVGTVFRLAADGTETVLHSFANDGVDGFSPYCQLVEDAGGYLFGTTLLGGVSGAGTVFRLTTAGAETLLHSFGGDALDGNSPAGGLLYANDGFYYGATANGGREAAGTVFKISPGGIESVVHYFSKDTPDGYGPGAGPIQGSDRNLYGTTIAGGADLGGTVYKLTGVVRPARARE